METVKASIACAHEFSEATFGVAYPIRHTYLDTYVREHGLLFPEPLPVKFDGKIIDWILFDTPHFKLEERLKGINLAIENRFYHNIDYNGADFDPSQKAFTPLYNEARFDPASLHKGWWASKGETRPSWFISVRKDGRVVLCQIERDGSRRRLGRKIDIAKTEDHFYAGAISWYPPPEKGASANPLYAYEGLAHLRFSGPDAGEVIFLTERGQETMTIKRCQDK